GPDLGRGNPGPTQKGGHELTERGPRTQDVDEEVQVLAQEVKDLGRSMTEGLAGLRADLAEFRGEVKIDLRWIKRIGASPLGTGLAFAGWVPWDIANLTADVRNQGTNLEKVEKRLDQFAQRIDVKLDAQGTRIEKVERRLDSIDAKLDAQGTHLEKVEK